MKVASSQFNGKLGEISEYVFKVVGLEVEKNIDEFSERISKIYKEADTLQKFKDRPSIMTDYLEEKKTNAMERFQEKLKAQRL